MLFYDRRSINSKQFRVFFADRLSDFQRVCHLRVLLYLLKAATKAKIVIREPLAANNGPQKVDLQCRLQSPDRNFFRIDCVVLVLIYFLRIVH